MSFPGIPSVIINFLKENLSDVPKVNLNDAQLAEKITTLPEEALQEYLATPIRALAVKLFTSKIEFMSVIDLNTFRRQLTQDIQRDQNDSLLLDSISDKAISQPATILMKRKLD